MDNAAAHGAGILPAAFVRSAGLGGRHQRQSGSRTPVVYISGPGDWLTAVSLPFAVLPLQYAFESMGRSSRGRRRATLRAQLLYAFFSVALPLARPGILTAAILVFAHTVGEFGVVLMIGGNIPGQTRVVSTQIYSHVEAMQYPAAHALSVFMLTFSFLVLVALAWLNRRRDRGPA